MQKIVVTGAAGFAGSHVLSAFNEANDNRIVAAVRNKHKLPEYYTGEVLEGDLLDSTYIEKLTKYTDVICHAAAWAELNGNKQDSDKYFYAPTIQLINSALKNRVKRFIFLSSVTSKPIHNQQLHTHKKIDKIWPHYGNIIRIEDYLNKVSKQGMEVIILRVGLFTGVNYSLGLLPILLPRLKTHLVPWVANGTTTLPLINGKDIGTAFRLAATAELSSPYHSIDIVGTEIPTVKQVFQYLHDKFGYPLPHFNVSFGFAYFFARTMQLMHKILPGDPLIVPAIVLLLEETHADNEYATKVLNYKPTIHWKESIDMQIAEMDKKQKTKMKMNKSNK